MLSGNKVRLCRNLTELWFIYDGDKMQKAKAQELKLTGIVSHNKKGFQSTLVARGALKKIQD